MAWKSELAYGADDIYGAYFGPKNQEGGRTVSRAKKFEVAVYNKEVRKLEKQVEQLPAILAEKVEGKSPLLGIVVGLR